VPDDQERAPEWIVAPPNPGALHVHIAVGRDVELTDAVRGLLEELTRLLQDDEVAGFVSAGRCTDLNGCTNYSCELGKCQPLEKLPCAFRIDCVVADYQRSPGMR
jgi:hypothetical protein